MSTSTAIAAPPLSWLPVRFIEDVARGRRAPDEVIALAPGFGFRYVELHQSFVPDSAAATRCASALRRLGLEVSMLVCAPDFTHPEAEVRRGELQAMHERLTMAVELGARLVRVTAGMEHEDSDPKEALARAADHILKLVPVADDLGLTLCLENHYRDRTWDALDASREPPAFLRLLELVDGSPVRVNYDTAQPMVMRADGVELLRAVVPKVAHVHAGDRRWGERTHSVIGEGDVRFGEVFDILREARYAGFVTVEDGSAAGDDGLRRGLHFLTARLHECWDAHA